MFGVPAFFLSEEAKGPFGNLIAQGSARVVDPAVLGQEIEKLSEPLVQPPKIAQPPLAETLRSLEKMSDSYHDLFVKSRAN